MYTACCEITPIKTICGGKEPGSLYARNLAQGGLVSYERRRFSTAGRHVRQGELKLNLCLQPNLRFGGLPQIMHCSGDAHARRLCPQYGQHSQPLRPDNGQSYQKLRPSKGALVETEPCDLVSATAAPDEVFAPTFALILLWPMCALSPVEDSPHNRTGTLMDVIAKSPNVL